MEISCPVCKTKLKETGREPMINYAGTSTTHEWILLRCPKCDFKCAAKGTIAKVSNVIERWD